MQLLSGEMASNKPRKKNEMQGGILWSLLPFKIASYGDNVQLKPLTFHAQHLIPDAGNDEFPFFIAFASDLNGKRTREHPSHVTIWLPNS